MKRRITAALAMMCCYTTSPALQPVDELYWPDTGKFPAYPAEPDDRRVHFSVIGGIDRDSNPFRLSDGASPVTTLGSTEKSDTLYRYGLGLKADIPVSRQQILLDLRVAEHNYSRFDVLDHTEYLGSAAWKWRAGSDWAGDVGYSRRQFMSNLAEIQAPIKDLIVEDRAFMSGGYMFSPRWRARGALDWIKWDHGDPGRQTLDATISSVTAGIDYVTPPGNYVGGQFKYSDGDYPNDQAVGAGAVDNSFKEYETSLVARWLVTGKSNVDARLGYTSRQHDQVPQRDFDGVTGRLTYDWFVAAKTLLNFALWREIRSSEDISAAYVLGQGWSFGPAWAPTSKMIFQLKYLREDRDYKGDPGFALAGTAPREDTVRGLNLSAGYSPRRNIRLSLAAERGERDSNTLGRDFDYTAISANAKFQF